MGAYKYLRKNLKLELFEHNNLLISLKAGKWSIVLYRLRVQYYLVLCYKDQFIFSSIQNNMNEFRIDVADIVSNKQLPTKLRSEFYIKMTDIVKKGKMPWEKQQI